MCIREHAQHAQMRTQARTHKYTLALIETYADADVYTHSQVRTYSFVP